MDGKKDREKEKRKIEKCATMMNRIIRKEKKCHDERKGEKVANGINNGRKGEVYEIQ